MFNSIIIVTLAYNVGAAWRRLLNEKFKVRKMFMVAFAKPLLCDGRFISTKINLKLK